jgi:CubicO group peptidase (beta-lactamase class C family)
MRTSRVRIIAAASMLVLSIGSGRSAPLAAQAASSASIVKGENGRRLDQFLTSHVPAGLSGAVLVARKGEILLHKGYGLANRSRNIPATTETVFDIGSITKQFTAAAIMKLEMDGKLSTEDKLTRFFKDVPADKTAITVHHLLTHTAGFDHGYGEDDVVAPRDPTLRLFLRQPLLSKPGEKYRYSNAGYSLLTAIVEDLSGQPYERYLHEQFFRPAGMTKTGYRIPKWNPLEVSRNYNGDKDNGPPLDRVWGPEGPYWHLFGNGGILSTPGDMYRWELALHEDKVLSSAARAKMFRPYVTMEGEGDTRYGYGWYTGRTASGASFVGHTGGSSFGVSAGHFRFPDDGLVVIYHFNRIPVPGNEKRGLLGRLADLAMGRPTSS